MATNESPDNGVMLEESLQIAMATQGSKKEVLGGDSTSVHFWMLNNGGCTLISAANKVRDSTTCYAVSHIAHTQTHTHTVSV